MELISLLGLLIRLLFLSSCLIDISSGVYMMDASSVPRSSSEIKIHSGQKNELRKGRTDYLLVRDNRPGRTAE